MLSCLCCLHSKTAFLQLEGSLTQIMMTSTAPLLCHLACCGVLDGFFMHADLLSETAWTTHLALLDHLMSPAADHNHQEAAAAAIGRLLLQYTDACTCNGVSEQLLDMLVSRQIRVSNDSNYMQHGASNILVDGQAVGNTQGREHQGMTTTTLVATFFDIYQQDHAEQLANTCVYIICNAAHTGQLAFNPSVGINLTQNEAHLKASLNFLTAMLGCSDLPEDALWLAACANLEEQWPEVQPEHISTVFANDLPFISCN